MGRQQIIAELRRLALHLTEISPDASHPGGSMFTSTTFSNAEYGWVSLSGEEQDRYLRLIDQICDEMGDSMSRAFIKDLVHRALFKTLDIRKANQGKSSKVRANEAADEVAHVLSSPRTSWASCVPILGIDPPNESWPLGDVTLIDIESDRGKELLQAADRITDSTQHTDADKETAKRDWRKMLVDDHPGQAFALVSTEAVDAEAAWDSAKRRLRFVFDCLNFAVDWLHGNLKFFEFSDDEPRKRG